MKQAGLAYATRPTGNEPRETESWALTEAARRLIDASRSPGRADSLQKALLLNQKLWTIFQAAISEDDCPLPMDLRQNLAALSLLVDRETTARLIDLDSSKLETLIEVNRNVASGLAQRPAPSTTATQPRKPADKQQPLTPKDRLRLSI